jgi:nucleoside-diphosphate-sugar epimerase
VIHSAARVEMVGRWEEFKESTVGGTQRLLAWALARGASRFVYVSSASVYAPEHADGTPVCADRTPARPSSHNYYARAKLAAEELVRTECERAGCPWCIVRLGFLYGPGNRALVRNILLLLRRKRLFIIGTGKNRIATVYIDDSARAVILGGTHSRAAGRVYDVASDETVTQRQFLEATAAALGQPPPSRRISRRWAYVAAFLSDQIARFPRLHPPFSRAMVQLMSADQVVDARPIRDELGWVPEVQFTEGMRRTREWYLAQQARAETSDS